MSSYYPPFVMLYFAAMSFHETTLTDVDKRVLSVIRDNWREMINRVRSIQALVRFLELIHCESTLVVE